MLPGFKAAPGKFVSQLAEQSEFDPEPAYIRQFVLGDRAVKNRGRGERLLASAMGGGVALFFASVAGLALTSLAWFVVCLVAILIAAAATAGLGLYYLWDAKMADMESRQLIAEGDAKIIDLGAPAEQQMEKSA